MSMVNLILVLFWIAALGDLVAPALVIDIKLLGRVVLWLVRR